MPVAQTGVLFQTHSLKDHILSDIFFLVKNLVFYKIHTFQKLNKSVDISIIKTFSSWLNQYALWTKIMFWSLWVVYEPLREKTNNLGFRSGPTQTSLFSNRSRLEVWNLGFK